MRKPGQSDAGLAQVVVERTLVPRKPSGRSGKHLAAEAVCLSSKRRVRVPASAAHHEKGNAPREDEEAAPSRSKSRLHA